MKVFVYYKRDNKPFVVLNDVKSVEENVKSICFKIDETSILEVDKKTYKSTAYQN